jgi:TetR/AcrR family transcriptional regulator
LNAREKILEAADTLFGEQGFDAATTREIAELSGVNKALIHYHFKNKDALLECVLDKYYDNLATVVKKPILSEGDVRDRIMTLIDLYSDFLSKNRNFCRIIQHEATGGTHMERIRERTIPIFLTGMEFMRREFPASSPGDLSAQHLLISFYGMIITYFTYSGILEQLLGTDPLSEKNLQARKRHLRRMAELILKEIRSPSETGPLGTRKNVSTRSVRKRKSASD